MSSISSPKFPPLSVLDLVPVQQGATAGEALRHSLALAQHAETLGFTRYWVAEHHNMTGIASAATSVVIGFLAQGTRQIRVGSGGIMLPNHSPLVIAEQFGTLASLYPGRIDCGLGRAPGTDQVTARAVRRDARAAESFPEDVQELQALFQPTRPGQAVQAFPGAGTDVPLWILGSSTYGAQLAAALGLPYAFASHFAPDALTQAMELYRHLFKPSEQLQKPHAMAGVNVIVADTDAEAKRLFTTHQQSFANLRRGRPGPQQPPIDDIDAYWSPAEKQMADSMLACSVVGSPETVRHGLERFVAYSGADELMVVSAIFDPDARRRSYSLLAEIAGLTPR
ncbi:MAG: LLM class flavin-dependent oxidoreductase [Caulobacter sp.]|nr:LLM class flavin-dependent oxidoreductase [Vitreoscilla sp.]